MTTLLVYFSEVVWVITAGTTHATEHVFYKFAQTPQTQGCRING